MKILLKIISISIIAVMAYFSSLNRSMPIDIELWGAHHVQLDFAYVICGVLILGIIVGVLWALGYYITVSDKLKEYQRKLEKTSVNAECDSSKVSVLESKIQVLEKALQSALEKNNE